jgi:6-phosphogluconolactonase
VVRGWVGAGLVAAAAALAGAGCSTGGGTAADGAAPDREVPDRLWVYVAASTLGDQIGILSLAPATGALSLTGMVDGPPAPRDMVWSRDRRFLYVVGENELVSFSIDRATGGLTRISSVVTEAVGAGSITLDAGGRWIWIVDPAGHFTVRPVLEGGGAGTQSFVSATQLSHAQVVTDPGGRFVFVLSCNDPRILRHMLDTSTGQLAATPPHAELPGGGGGRRLAFHPSGRWAYGLNPAAGSVTAFRYDGASGALTEPRTVTFLPDSMEGPSSCPSSGRVVVHPSGKFLYASSPHAGGRVAIFSLDPAPGSPTLVGQEVYHVFRGADPMDVDPSGSMLLVGNTAGGLLVFRIDAASGLLSYVDFGPGAQGARFVGVLPF